jgi:hypothetical protein
MFPPSLLDFYCRPQPYQVGQDLSLSTPLPLLPVPGSSGSRQLPGLLLGTLPPLLLPRGWSILPSIGCDEFNSPQYASPSPIPIDHPPLHACTLMILAHSSVPLPSHWPMTVQCVHSSQRLLWQIWLILVSPSPLPSLADNPPCCLAFDNFSVWPVSVFLLPEK